MKFEEFSRWSWSAWQPEPSEIAWVLSFALQNKETSMYPITAGNHTSWGDFIIGFAF